MCVYLMDIREESEACDHDPNGNDAEIGECNVIAIAIYASKWVKPSNHYT